MTRGTNDQVREILTTLVDFMEAEEVHHDSEFITLECIPNPRWKAFQIATRDGKPWTWEEREIRHLNACSFCAGLRRKCLTASVIAVPTASAAQFDAPATVAGVAAGQGTLEYGQVVSAAVEEDTSVLVRMAITTTVQKILANLATHDTRALQVAINDVFAELWPPSRLTQTQRRLLWCQAAQILADTDRFSAIMLLAEKGGFDNFEIATVLGISPKEVVRERVFGG
jgi:hypothetical protein